MFTHDFEFPNKILVCNTNGTTSSCIFPLNLDKFANKHSTTVCGNNNTTNLNWTLNEEKGGWIKSQKNVIYGSICMLDAHFGDWEEREKEKKGSKKKLDKSEWERERVCEWYPLPFFMMHTIELWCHKYNACNIEIQWAELRNKKWKWNVKKAKISFKYVFFAKN